MQNQKTKDKQAELDKRQIENELLEKEKQKQLANEINLAIDKANATTSNGMRNEKKRKACDILDELDEITIESDNANDSDDDIDDIVETLFYL